MSISCYIYLSWRYFSFWPASVLYWSNFRWTKKPDIIYKTENLINFWCTTNIHVIPSNTFLLFREHFSLQKMKRKHNLRLRCFPWEWKGIFGFLDFIFFCLNPIIHWDSLITFYILQKKSRLIGGMNFSILSDICCWWLLLARFLISILGQILQCSFDSFNMHLICFFIVSTWTNIS